VDIVDLHITASDAEAKGLSGREPIEAQQPVREPPGVSCWQCQGLLR
jgi:hypothetical protein